MRAIYTVRQSRRSPHAAFFRQGEIDFESR
jgi:hypothetical protein